MIRRFPDMRRVREHYSAGDRIAVGTAAAAGLAVIVVVLLLAISPARAQPDRAALDKRVAELAEFVRLITGYDMPVRPKIVFRAQDDLDRMYFGENWRPDLKGWIGALQSGGVIFLNENFELGRDDYMLVHELAHVGQFEAGKDGEGCTGRLEPEAYRVQDIFVAATGRGEPSDALTVMMAQAACDGPQ